MTKTRIASFGTWVTFLLVTHFVVAQSATTTKLEKSDPESMSFYFYKNTLRMLNQSEDAAFDEAIKDIEELKFLMVGSEHMPYRAIKKGYLSEGYEELMAGRMDGRALNVFGLEDDGEIKGTIVLVNDSSSVFILDLLGKIDINKSGTLFKKLGETSEISNLMQNFLDKDESSEDDPDN